LIMAVKAVLSSRGAFLAARIEKREPFSLTVSLLTDSRRLTDFIALMKPRVMSLAVFTALVGLLIAPGHLDPIHGAIAILAIAGRTGAAGVLNTWYDADIDGVMSRTAMRPIPRGRISRVEALVFGLLLAGSAVVALTLSAKPTAAALLAVTIFFYIVVYTIWLKRRTPQNIVKGGAGKSLSLKTAPASPYRRTLWYRYLKLGYSAPIVNYLSKYSRMRETDTGAGNTSSMPHSSASHHNSEVLVGLTSATGMDFPLRLTPSTRSLQLPSLSASSVMTTVPSGAELSKVVAASIVCTKRTRTPRASISVSVTGSALFAHTTITVFSGSSVCIACIVSPLDDLDCSVVSYTPNCRKLP
jgi:hypothetical protein